MLEEQAFPFEEKAIELFETNARRTQEGLYDRMGAGAAWRRWPSLKPVRYGKAERGVGGAGTTSAAMDVAALQARNEHLADAAAAVC
jgi:hypothetical protein